MTKREEFIPSLTYEGGDNWETFLYAKYVKSNTAIRLIDGLYLKNYVRNYGLKKEYGTVKYDRN